MPSSELYWVLFPIPVLLPLLRGAGCPCEEEGELTSFPDLEQNSCSLRLPQHLKWLWLACSLLSGPHLLVSVLRVRLLLCCKSPKCC